QPLDRRIRRRAFGDRPALHHAVELQPQVEVQACRRVFLDDEVELPGGPGALFRGAAFRLSRLPEITFLPVFGELLAGAAAWLLAGGHAVLVTSVTPGGARIMR